MSQWNYKDRCRTCGNELGWKRAKGLCQRCYGKEYKAHHQKEARAAQRTYYHKNPKKFMDRIKARWEIRKAEAIEKMGGRCVCCGETEKLFLCLDHIKGGGRWDYQKSGGPHGVWKRAMKEGLPKSKYRLLCWNCNAALGLHGFYPHSDLTSPTYHGKSKYTLNL